MDCVWRRLSATLSRRIDDLFRRHRFGLYILAVLTGLASDLDTVPSRLGIDAWSQLLSGADGYTVSTGPSVRLPVPLGTWFVLVTPVLSGLLTGPLISRLGQTPTGHGVTGIIWSTCHGDGTMAPLPALAVTTSAALTIGGGDPVGSKGSIAELGASTASIVGRGLRLRRSPIRHLVAAGTATGIASAFNASLAGAFFALEAILTDLSADAFVVIVLAYVSLTVLLCHLLETTLSLSLPYLDLSGSTQLGWVALLGAVGGGVGIGFTRLRFTILDALTRAWQRLGVSIQARPGISGLTVGATFLVLPEMCDESSAALNQALAGRYALTLLPVLCVAKMLATSLTLETDFVDGVFALSLFIGRTFDATFGTLVAPNYVPATGAFEVIGMGAVFADVVRAPMTAVLLIIEMTGQHALLMLPMLATILAIFISRFLSRGTLFIEELCRRGEDIEDLMATALLERVRASQLMVDPSTVLQTTTSLSQAAPVVSRRDLSALPVVTIGQSGAGELLGCVTTAQLVGAFLNENSGDVSAQPVAVVNLSLVRDRLNSKGEATGMLQTLTDTRPEGLPAVAHAAGSDMEGLVGWVSQRIVVERVYEAQAQTRTAAATYISWGSRLQSRWYSRPVPRHKIGRISRVGRVSSHGSRSLRSSRRSRRR